VGRGGGFLVWVFFNRRHRAPGRGIGRGRGGGGWPPGPPPPPPLPPLARLICVRVLPGTPTPGYRRRNMWINSRARLKHLDSARILVLTNFDPRSAAVGRCVETGAAKGTWLVPLKGSYPPTFTAFWPRSVAISGSCDRRCHTRRGTNQQLGCTASLHCSGSVTCRTQASLPLKETRPPRRLVDSPPTPKNSSCRKLKTTAASLHRRYCSCLGSQASAGRPMRH